MSVRVMSRVWQDTPLRENELLVLLALADWANDAGECWPSYPRIAEKARIDIRSAKSIVARLCAAGYVTVTRGGGRHRPNIYTVHVPPIVPSELAETVTQHHPLPPENGAVVGTETVNSQNSNSGVGAHKQWPPPRSKHR